MVQTDMGLTDPHARSADDCLAELHASSGGLTAEEAARRLGVSRTTLSRTLARARRTVTLALIGGHRLVLEPERRPPAAPAVEDAEAGRSG